MSAEKEPENGVSEYQYEIDKESRVMPQDLRLFESCIFRVLTPPKLMPPFAYDVPVCVVNEDISEQNCIYLEHEDKSGRKEGKSVYIASFNGAGFIVHDNVGPRRNLELPEGIVTRGYLMHSVESFELERLAMVSLLRKYNLVDSLN
jgi:hypothetical protein